MAYERQISPTSIDELSALNCNTALGFVGLTLTGMPPNEENSQGKTLDFAISYHHVVTY